MKLKKSIMAQAIVFFLIFLSFRVSGILELSLQVDEVHWRARSVEILQQIKARNWSMVTTHLGQPGITPAITMAFFEWSAKKLGLLGLEVGDIKLDYFHFARIGCAFVSSLVVFPMLFLGSNLFGRKLATLACSFLLVSPGHIGLSKLAHLDAVLTFLVITTALFYFVGIIRKRTDFLVASGIFWGLAIATKPTAVAVPLGFLLWKISLVFFKKIPVNKLIQISDLWIVFIGHLIFSLIYTRIWRHESDYLIRLNIISPVADFFYDTGSKLHFAWPFLVLLVLFIFYRNIKNNRSNLDSFLLLITSLLSFWITFPFVTEGLVRFWTWALGLSSHVHVAYGHATEPFPFGYLGIILRDLSPLRLIGLFGGIIFLLTQIIRGKLSDQELCLLGILIVFLTWTILLSASSKQTVRYIMPVVKLTLFITSYFYLKIFNYVRRQLSNYNLISGRVFASTCLVAVVIPDLLSILRLSPYEMMYENRIFNYFFSGSEIAGQSYTVGLNQTVRFLHKESSDTKAEVYVYGDDNALKLTQSVIPPYTKMTEFFPPKKIIWGHLLVRFNSYDHAFKELLPDGIDNYVPLFSANFEDRKIITVYREPLPDLTEEKIIPVRDFYKMKGVISKSRLKEIFPNFETCPDDLGCLGIQSGRSRKGTILFGLDPFFEPGDYVFSSKVVKAIGSKESDRPLLKFKVGKCEKTFSGKDINSDHFIEIILECHFDNLKPQRISIYWFGTESLIFSDLAVIRKQHTLIQ